MDTARNMLKFGPCSSQTRWNFPKEKFAGWNSVLWQMKFPVIDVHVTRFNCLYGKFSCATTGYSLMEPAQQNARVVQATRARDQRHKLPSRVCLSKSVKGISFLRNCSATSVGLLTTWFDFINWANDLNWPPSERGVSAREISLPISIDVQLK